MQQTCKILMRLYKNSAIKLRIYDIILCKITVQIKTDLYAFCFSNLLLSFLQLFLKEKLGKEKLRKGRGKERKCTIVII
ncbi:hypothetical protein BpHYR1_017553 [Brachionus plicatilis]|uniref:Uncharacterized protein n=1 Tax=Brachionus plicatilis TaxID=10195 RepID=A0A3M7RRJ5_BRAPC|nr:hypothetical protein BpHYR1_017553 [Brachionus plicatilis]